MSVALSIGIRTSLFALGDIGSQTATANKRLATGKKVSEAIDNPLNFFLAKGFDKNKLDLSNLLDTQNVALGSLNKTIKSIESITKLVEQVQGLARQALQSSDDSAGGVRATLGEQIESTLNQITELTRDSGFNGKNLVGRTPDTLSISFNNETGANLTKLDVAGVDLRFNSALLGFGTAAQGFTTAAVPAPGIETTSFNGVGATGFANDAAGNGRIQALIDNSVNAVNRLQSVASTFAVNLSVLQVRIDYSKAQQRTLATASDAITLADVNEEGASLAALQTRQQIAVQALSLANQADQGILRLF
jgi:flagellin-like hook-associated protein FlgL